MHNKFNRIFLFSVFFLLQACSSLEVVSKVPVKNGTFEVKDPIIDLYKNPIHIFDPIDLSPKIASLELLPRVKNLIVLVDRSQGSVMGYRSVPVDILSSELLRRFLVTLPDDFNLYVVAAGGDVNHENVALSNVQKSKLLNTSGSVIPLISVGSDINSALDYLSEHLPYVDGSVAVITLANWDKFTPEVVNTLSRIKQQRDFAYGKKISKSVDSWSDLSVEGVCLFQLGIGNKFSNSVVGEIDGCVVSIAADLIFQPEDIADFIETHLYSFPLDNDGDGIPNYTDKCPSTEKGRLVGYDGCDAFSLRVRF